MGEPERIDAVPIDFMERTARLVAAHEAYLKTPEGQAREAEIEARRARAAAAKEEIDFRAWMAAADARGVPGHRTLRELCHAARAHRTPALAAVAALLAWRRERTDRYGAPPATLVLSGRPGGGKTVALARLAARSAEEARYLVARRIATLPENDWSANREERDALARVPVLALDELGLEDARQAGPRIAGLLSERHDHGLVTVCATNLDADTFVARYVTDRLVSRLALEQGAAGASDGLAWWCELPDVDLRDPGNRDALAGPSLRRAP